MSNTTDDVRQLTNAVRKNYAVPNPDGPGLIISDEYEEELRAAIKALIHRTQLESRLSELNDVLKVASDNGHPNLKLTFQYMLDRIKELEAALEKQA